MRKSIMNLLVAAGAVLAPSVTNALEIRSVSVAEVREGEPVSVTAYVTWSGHGRSTAILSPDANTHVVRTVSAKILPRQSAQGFYWIQPSGSGNTASGTPPTPPAPPPEISLTLFSAIAGSYRGKFPLLPSTFHTVEVTAKQTSYAVRNGQPTPYVIASEEKKLTKDFVVGLPEDCFNFPSGDLEGWQMSLYGTSNGTGPKLVGLTAQADGDDFGTAGGLQTKALRVKLDQSLWPPLDQFSEYWSMQFVSPALESRAGWQTIKGFTFRVQNFLAHVGSPFTFIPGVYIRKPTTNSDGSGPEEVWVQQPLPGDAWAVWHVPQALNSSYSTVLTTPPIPAGATILQLRLHVYGLVSGNLTNIYTSTDTIQSPPKRLRIDAICPIH